MDALKTANPTLAIKNWYGPTETTTYSSIIDLSSEFIPAIGVALAHEEIRVCNARLQEVPDGIEGELIIGGEGVALGYLNASGGFYTKDGTQYYRTGDFGSISNGLIYLKGRTDRQVKRLGQRFELGEVEAGILKTFIQVSRVRYLVENHRFILFIEHPNTTHSIAEFKEFLLQKFPAYMRPDHILLIAAFPLSWSSSALFCPGISFIKGFGVFGLFARVGFAALQVASSFALSPVCFTNGFGAEGATFAMIPSIKKDLTGRIAGMAGAYGNVGAVAYLFILTQVDYKSFFFILSVGAAISVVACYFLLKEPKGSFGEEDETELEVA